LDDRRETTEAFNELKRIEQELQSNPPRTLEALDDVIRQTAKAHAVCKARLDATRDLLNTISK
jgi:hypothetical protein